MKLITLLNKIAKGEKPPKKIKYYDTKYKYSEEEGSYLLYGELNKKDNGRYLEDFNAIINQEMLNKQVEVEDE